MERQIVLKKRYMNSLLKVITYLQAEWGEKVTAEFVARLDKRLLGLLSQPYTGIQSEVVKYVRGILITRHNKVSNQTQLSCYYFVYNSMGIQV
ncbi:hypothetical protein, partial [Parasediminibacterium sp. JCM 36343]|uniref:hypothetical protein n=1 Tax=Parasediminibacterium sp. JCM 36343 TaxID=3374279 RepID=UPI00397C5C72